MRFASETRPTGPRLPVFRSSSGKAVGSGRASAKTWSFVLARSRAHLSAVIPCAFSSICPPRLRACFVVVVLLTMCCLSGRNDAFAMTALHETDRQEHVTHETCD